MEKSKILIRRFIARRLSKLVSLFYYFKFKFISFKNKEPIFILTPGKVGSSSVYNTLKKEIPNPVFHIHHLSFKGIQKSQEVHLNSNRKSLPLHLIISAQLKKKLDNFEGNLNVITIIREPISREISSFFQNMELYKDIIESKNLKINKNKLTEVLNNIFNTNICINLENWFFEEIKENFDIDVFEKEFDYNNGYMIIKKGRTNLLLLKMETMNEVFSRAIKEFLSINTCINLSNSNIALNKSYAADYEYIRENFKIRSAIVEKIICSKYFQHFYSTFEVKIRDRWFQEQDALQQMKRQL